MKSLLNYFGNKSRLASKYPPPNRDIVCEPFAGGAGYSLYYEIEKAILIEKDPDVAAIWNWLTVAEPADLLALPLEPMHPRDIDAPQPAKDLISFWQQRRAAHRKHTLCESTRKHMLNNNNGYWGKAVRDRIISALPLIRNWEIHNCSWEQADAIVDGRDVLWFVDPPYFSTTGQGMHYRYQAKHIDYDALGGWCRGKDSIIVCEGAEADWLPFTVLETRMNQKNSIYQEKVWMHGFDNDIFEEE